MSLPGATDVITFDHGEVHISTETARRQGAEHGNPEDRETMLYLIHGLLHLAGYEDKSDGGFNAMRAKQEDILEQLWPPAD